MRQTPQQGPTRPVDDDRLETISAGTGTPPQPGPDISDGARRWRDWKGASLWDSLTALLTGKKPHF